MPRLPAHFASACAAIALAVLTISPVVSVPPEQAAISLAVPALA